MLCLKGGVPPLFAARDGALYLLTNSEGGPLGAEFFGLVGDDIRYGRGYSIGP